MMNNTMTKIMSLFLMLLCWNSQIVCSEMTRDQKIALQKERLVLVNQMSSSHGKNMVINSKNNNDCHTIGNSSFVNGSISGNEGDIIFTGSKGRAVMGVSSSTLQVKVFFLENACQNNVVINLASRTTKIVVESQSRKSNMQQNIVTVYTFGTPCVINKGGACVNVSFPLRVSSLSLQWFIPVAFVGIISFAYWIICRKKAI